MNATSDYKPIPCDAHERLEYAVLKRQWLNVSDKAGERQGWIRMLPLDVFTRDGAEWLQAETESGEQRLLRLDELEFEADRG